MIDVVYFLYFVNEKEIDVVYYFLCSMNVNGAARGDMVPDYCLGLSISDDGVFRPFSNNTRVLCLFTVLLFQLRVSKEKLVQPRKQNEHNTAMGARSAAVICTAHFGLTCHVQPFCTYERAFQFGSVCHPVFWFGGGGRPCH